MVSPSYMTSRPAPASAARRFFDQRLIPAAIDGLACLERVAEHVAQRTRRHPSSAVMAAAGLGFLLALSRARRR